MVDDPVIHAVGIEKSFGGTQVLAGVDLCVPAGTVLALLGPNGAGKTTMVRILSTLLRPDAGSARIGGHDLATAPDQVRAMISLTGQYAAVDDLLTGTENMMMMGRLARLDRRETRRRSVELLERFDLMAARGRLVKTYSGGMRRRLDLAVSLLSRPAVLFLDEPTTGLDPRSRQTTWGLVRDLVTEGITVLLTTQYLEEADRLADRISVLDGGRVIAEGTADELKSRIGGEQVNLLFADRDSLDHARRDLGERVIEGADDGARLAVRVATDGSARAVRELLGRLDEVGIDVARVELRRPSLDDVFLDLTGRRPASESASASASASGPDPGRGPDPAPAPAGRDSRDRTELAGSGR